MLPRKILVCTDFSDNSLQARLYATEYAKAFGAELCVLHIVNSRMWGYPAFAAGALTEMATIEEHIRRGVEEELEIIANDCKREIDQVTVYSRTGAPAEEIVAFADEESIDLIVMGTHGWTGARHLLMGSTAENVLRTANCPVLTLRVSQTV